MIMTKLESLILHKIEMLHERLDLHIEECRRERRRVLRGLKK